MASAKAALRAARTALEARNYEEAANQARTALEADPESYFANVFLGRALEKQDKYDQAAAAYQAATKAKPNDENAWKGLCSVYEASKDVDAYYHAALKLAEIYMEADDQHQCQTVIDKIVQFAKEHGSRIQYKHALGVYLPSSPVFGFLEGRIQSPALTFRRLAEITDADDEEKISRDIGERRLRLGAKLSQVMADVRREVYDMTDAEQLYQSVIDWTQDDDERREFEEKLLHHAYEHLIALTGDAKANKRTQVLDLAHGMVVIKYGMALAWHVELEWMDAESFQHVDQNLLTEYCRLFPSSGLASVLQGYLGVQMGIEENDDVDGDEKKGPKRLSTEDRLVLLTNGIADCKDSTLAHRLVAEYFLQIQEHESSVEESRLALTLLQAESTKSGLQMHESFDAIRTNLGTALVYYQSPKNHPEAATLFEGVLKRKPHSTNALLGIGLIHEEREDFEQASTFLGRALERDPTNSKIAAEAAWCKSLSGHREAGLSQLQESLEAMKEAKGTPFDLKAQTLYRVGKCMWEIGTDKASRRARDGPYSYYIAALKADPSFAPAYTALGIYYSDYAKDRRRARQCFQKAFELSASEVFAAEQLARDFARAAEWDIVEVIAQRAIDSGVVRPAPGSKRKPVDWPFAAMAVVQMNKQEYPLAVHSYQSALRISPQDVNSWVGLGESYLSSGRYNAASKVLEHAQTLIKTPEDGWFAQYMHSNVHRELGDYDRAIEGYRTVLNSRPDEFGVSLALLQTLVECAQDCIEKGFFEKAAKLAQDAIGEADVMLQKHDPTVNFWKAVGDGCAVFIHVPGLKQDFPLATIARVLSKATPAESHAILRDLDQIDLASLESEDENSVSEGRSFYQILIASIIAQKRAVEAAQKDVHARAVAWYNLGWTEFTVYRAISSISDADWTSKLADSAKAAVKCFKRAIELEAGNADFWNALGVVTTTLNAKVAQHSFVRSLHLNERSARTWVNLGALYMFEGDFELAHESFKRAQSTEPDYMYAWLGEGLIATHTGNEMEAYSHFAHAIEIADASGVAVKAQYAAASFDDLLSRESKLLAFDGLTGPIFALQQLRVQSLELLRFRHLLALFQERAGDCQSAVENLNIVADTAERVYETSESATALGQFVRLKSDLARCQLATGDLESAVENATVAIDLTEEADEASLSSEQRNKVRLSSHLTGGVAGFYTGNMDDAIQSFRAALEESDGNQDVICLLARVLWAKGSEAERGVAKEQLLESIEKHAGHVESTLLLGAMSCLDNDHSTHEAVMEDLQSMRGGSALSLKQQTQIDDLLRTSALLFKPAPEEELNEINRAIMLAPNQPTGWSALAAVQDEESIANMAYETAARATPPDGPLTAEELSKAAAQTGTMMAAQRSVVLSPWQTDGWTAMHAALG